MKTNLLCASSALALIVAGAASAQDTETTQSEGDLQGDFLGEIILSGGFTPIEEQEYGRSATVITSEEIETRGITTVQDALRAVPGVSVSGSGNSFTQVRIRGGESNHTLILIDGIPAAGGNAEYILTGLETANIERIEVLRGPQSVFYGSNASSGVINIITKRGGQGHEAGATVEIGEGYNVTARYSYRNDRGGLALGLSRLDDDGFDYSGDGGEEDGIRRSTISLTGDYLLTDQLKIGVVYRYSDEQFDFDRTSFTATTAEEYVVDDPTLFSDRKETLGSLWAEYDMMDGRMRHRLSLEYSDFETISNTGSRNQSDRKQARYLMSFGLDGTVDAADHLINVIAEYREDSSTTNPTYRPARSSFAAEYRGNFNNGLSLQGGLRYDNNRTFENDVTWNIGASYLLASGVRIHGSAGEGSVDPSFFELFANSFGFVGNPNLTPEKNLSFDLGVEVPFAAGRGLVDVTLFHETLQDEITSIFDPVAGNSTFINQEGDSTRRGVEVAGSWAATDTTDLRLSYTYLDAENPDGTVEVRRPEHELLLGLTQEFAQGRGLFNADLRYVAGNFDTQFFGANFGNAVQLPDYVTVDIAAQYDLTDNLILTGRVTNLFDEEYSDVWGYAKRGRAAYIGLRANF